jgi:hypothetical protein
MAGNGRGSRSRWDHAADVAQTVRAGALSPQDLMSRPAQRAAHRFAQTRRRAMKEAVAVPPQSNAGPVADGRKPSLGRQMRPRRLQRVAGAFRADRPPTLASRQSGES